jgi:polysaccharide deacetylase 2 family uncharacterized protein YibQ
VEQEAIITIKLPEGKLPEMNTLTITVGQLGEDKKPAKRVHKLESAVSPNPLPYISKISKQLFSSR